MAAVDDILRSYRRPGAVVRAHLARARSEPRLFTLLFSALLVMLIAQWPALARQSLEHAGQPLAGLMLATAMAFAAATPLIYALAWLVSQGLRLFRGRGDNYGSRLALFWAFLAVSPLTLLHGLVLGIIGPGFQADIVLGLVFLVMAFFWGIGLKVTQFDAPEPPAGAHP